MSYSKAVESRDKTLLHRPQYQRPKPKFLGTEVSNNALEEALIYSKDQDIIMLNYLPEYYCQHSMDHIGWMISIAKNFHDLSKIEHGKLIIQ